MRLVLDLDELVQDPYICDPTRYLATEGIGGWHGVNANTRNAARDSVWPCCVCRKPLIYDWQMDAWKDSTHYILEEP